MRRGGKRPGAGRKKGARAKSTIAQTLSLSELAQEHTEAAIAALVKIMNHGESEKAIVSAAQVILDRGHGRPVQAHEHGGVGGGPIVIHIDATDAAA